MSRPRNANSLRRIPGARQRGDYILIVCEGEKTEPLYLKEMVRDLNLRSANVTICGDCGSAPQSVVAEAIRLFEADGGHFDKVFCVIDRDGHARFDEAMDKIRQHKLVRKEGRRVVHTAEFVAIPSIPCFEFWILLHYRLTTAHMNRFADVREVLRGIPGYATYDKGSSNLYEKTKELLDDAVRNAENANRQAEATGTDNPTTAMPTLIQALRQMAENLP